MKGRSSSPGDASPDVPSRHSGHRGARPRPSKVTVSNRSSPEQSPERAFKLKPLTTSNKRPGRSASPGLEVSQASRRSSQSPNGRLVRPTPVYAYTPMSEKLSYFGSNESERTDSLDDEDGDASSSDETSTETEQVDKASELQQGSNDASLDGSSGKAKGSRRELLVQRPVLDQHFATGWEQALWRSKSMSQPRPRSLTPSNTSSLASGRRGSSSNNIPDASTGKPLNIPSRSGTPTSQPPSPMYQHKQVIPFRTDLLPEVFLLTSSLVLAAYRLARLPRPLDLDSQPMPPIPLTPLILIIFAIPCVSLFRRKTFQSIYMFPFTDERGYRMPANVDDGFAAGAAVPVLLAAGFLWEAVMQDGDGHQAATMGSIRPIMDVWQAAGLIPVQGIVNASPAQMHSSLVVARISLLLSTSINSFVLILHLVLSRTALKVERLPTDNTKRLFGTLLLSCSVSFVLWAFLALNDRFAWGQCLC